MLIFLAASTWVAAEASASGDRGFQFVCRQSGGAAGRAAPGKLRAGDGFLAAEDFARLRRSELIIEQLTPASGAELPGALLHDWRGTAFVPGAKAADFERLMRNFNAYPQRYAPEVLTAKVLAQQGDQYQVTMRVRQKHILTVVMDTAYDVAFGRLDAQRGYSISRSTKIREIDSPARPTSVRSAPAKSTAFCGG